MLDGTRERATTWPRRVFNLLGAAVLFPVALRGQISVDIIPAAIVRVSDSTLAIGAFKVTVPISRGYWLTGETRPCLESQSPEEMKWNDMVYGAAYPPPCVNYVGVAIFYSLSGQIRLAWWPLTVPPTCGCPVDVAQQLPDAATPLGTWSVTNGAWDSTGADSVSGGKAFVAQVSETSTAVAVTLTAN